MPEVIFLQKIVCFWFLMFGTFRIYLYIGITLSDCNIAHRFRNFKVEYCTKQRKCSCTKYKNPRQGDKLGIDNTWKNLIYCYCWAAWNLCPALKSFNFISVLVASRPAWVAELNKRTGCDSPRCRRCKCREGLPLTKVSHWIFPRRQTGSLLKTQVRRTTRIRLLQLPALWKSVGMDDRRKTAAVAMGTATAAYFIPAVPPAAEEMPWAEIATPPAFTQ